MPDRIEPTPEAPSGPDRATNAARDNEKLTTASLVGRTQGRPPEQTRSFASDESKDDAQHAPLFATEESARLRDQWNEVQASFVDEPRQAVEQADQLVATAIKRLAEMFADEKARLEGQWDRGGEISTEDLRQALRRYRSFFGRVLSV